MYKHLLVPTDGSELSQVAIEQAVRFASSLGAHVTFYYAQPDFPMPIYGEGALIDPTTPESFAQAAEAEAKEILARATAVAEQAGVAADTDTSVSEAPYEGIVAAAEKHACDLIFMASHGRKGFVGLLLGSEAKKVLTHSKVPILIHR